MYHVDYLSPEYYNPPAPLKAASRGASRPPAVVRRFLSQQRWLHCGPLHHSSDLLSCILRRPLHKLAIQLSSKTLPSSSRQRRLTGRRAAKPVATDTRPRFAPAAHSAEPVALLRGDQPAGLCSHPASMQDERRRRPWGIRARICGLWPEDSFDDHFMTRYHRMGCGPV